MASLLLCRPDRVGDAIIATSCFAPIRAQQKPGDKLFFAARVGMRSLLDGHPLLDGFIPLPDSTAPGGNATPARCAMLADQFAACQADAFVTLHPDDTAQRAAQAAAIPVRLGYRRSLFSDWNLTKCLPDHRHEGARHEAEYNFELLAPLGIQAPPAGHLRPSIHLADSWRQSLSIRLAAAGFDHFDTDDAGYAVVNPTAFSHDHRWPPEHFAWLALELLKPGRFARVFIIGDSLDDPSARKLRHLLGAGLAGLIDLSGQTTLGELGWLLRHARLLVSRNTGTSHLAAAVGCPTVDLFGRLEGAYGPTRWRPLNPDATLILTPLTQRRWGEGKRAFWKRGHAAISRESVLEAALKRLSTRPADGANADKGQ